MSGLERTFSRGSLSRQCSRSLLFVPSVGISVRGCGGISSSVRVGLVERSGSRVELRIID